MPTYHVFGVVVFAGNGQRNRAESALTAEAASRGFTATAHAGLPAGPSRATVAGKPALRFAYATTDQTAALATVGDMAARLELDEPSWWATCTSGG